MLKKNRVFIVLFLAGILTGYGVYAIVNHRHKLLSFIGYGKKRTPVDKNLLYSDSSAVILTMGQSNAASFGQGEYVCHNAVYQYYEGKLVVAREPLLGAYGVGSSVWTRVSDMLIDSGHFKRIILVSIGIGNSSLQCWVDGECNKILIETLQQLNKDKVKPTYIVWHQGETDNFENTPKAVYKAGLHSILSQIRRQGINSDFYVCVASYIPSQIGIKHNGIDTAIQNAQIEFVNNVKGARSGANTDSINLAVDRHDGLHFSRIGLDKFAAEMYYKLIVP